MSSIQRCLGKVVIIELPVVGSCSLGLFRHILLGWLLHSRFALGGLDGISKA
jgi:hypothetical protein